MTRTAWWRVFPVLLLYLSALQPASSRRRHVVVAKIWTPRLLEQRTTLAGVTSEPLLSVGLDGSEQRSAGTLQQDAWDSSAAMQAADAGSADAAASGRDWTERSQPAAPPPPWVPFSGPLPPAPPPNDFVQMGLGARNADNRVIITFGSLASILTQLPVLLHGMRAADKVDMTQHLVVVTMGERALDACRRLHRFCVSDTWETSLGSRQERERAAADPTYVPEPPRNASWEVGTITVRYGSALYRSIIWRKHELVRDLLFAGADVVLMDMDLIVFRNFLRDDVLDYASGADILIEKEHFRNPCRLSNVGFYFMRSSPAAKAFMMDWLHAAHRGVWDQTAFNDLLLTEGYRPELRWQHIPLAAGLNVCVLRHVFANFTEVSHLKAAIVKLVNDPCYSDAMTFFHCACWFDDIRFSKSDAMHYMLNYYLERKYILTR